VTTTRSLALFVLPETKEQQRDQVGKSDKSYPLEFIYK